MSKYPNQEAFVLSAKRIKARIARAKELKVDKLDHEGIVKLVEDLTLAKAIADEKTVDLCRRGQEYYMQTLIDSVTKPIGELMDIEYNQATLELGSEEEILTSLMAAQTA